MRDEYRVLPHRDIRRDYTTNYEYEHRPCGQRLSERDVKEANWCPHCPAVINKAAEKRGRTAIAMAIANDEDGFTRRSRLLAEQADITERRHGRVQMTNNANGDEATQLLELFTHFTSDQRRMTQTQFERLAKAYPHKCQHYAGYTDLWLTAIADVRDGASLWVSE